MVTVGWSMWRMVMRMPTTTVHRPLTMPEAQLMTLMTDFLISQLGMGGKETGGGSPGLHKSIRSIYGDFIHKSTCLIYGYRRPRSLEAFASRTAMSTADSWSLPTADSRMKNGA